MKVSWIKNFKKMKDKLFEEDSILSAGYCSGIHIKLRSVSFGHSSRGIKSSFLFSDRVGWLHYAKFPEIPLSCWPLLASGRTAEIFTARPKCARMQAETERKREKGKKKKGKKISQLRHDWIRDRHDNAANLTILVAIVTRSSLQCDWFIIRQPTN